ncbi:hypothetical protein Cgig2_018303 [Carnegiea gigantea]|uniref:Uncharacterized protein n=1 Tax=Carnegiea gigantea TaxID=171969 RepID=A0A9Q1KXT5_9CARY|nr:hypothetical protein Cgig2_018301 [Carnegiea gigantea]KAJ8451669.1 hypothetical protein Cgig2_018303 [Carnegiea gigantea]
MRCTIAWRGAPHQITSRFARYSAVANGSTAQAGGMHGGIRSIGFLDVCFSLLLGFSSVSFVALLPELAPFKVITGTTVEQITRLSWLTGRHPSLDGGVGASVLHCGGFGSLSVTGSHVAKRGKHLRIEIFCINEAIDSQMIPRCSLRCPIFAL